MPASEPFQSEVRRWLTDLYGESGFLDNTSDTEHFDFRFQVSPGGEEDTTKIVDFHLELKEKGSNNNGYSLASWPMWDCEEQFLFILDDLTYRKMLFHPSHGLYSGLLIRDSIRMEYYFWSSLELAESTVRIKVNRETAFNGFPSRKGKLLLDLRTAKKSDSLDGVMAYVFDYADCAENWAFQPQAYECQGESVPVSGTTRDDSYRQFDLQNCGEICR